MREWLRARCEKSKHVVVSLGDLEDYAFIKLCVGNVYYCTSGLKKTVSSVKTKPRFHGQRTADRTRVVTVSSGPVVTYIVHETLYPHQISDDPVGPVVSVVDNGHPTLHIYNVRIHE